MRQVPYNWPNFQNSKVVDKDGNLTGEWSMIFQQFFSYAQANLSNEGYRLPQQTTANITKLNTVPVNQQGSIPNGTMFYDTDTNQFKIKINGTIRVVTTS